MIKIKDIKWKVTGVELFYGTVIVLACAKMAYALPDTVDLQLYDETAYLQRGIQFHWRVLFTDGALYLMWYKLLSFLVTDTITLYYLNYTLLLCLNPLLIYILLRKMGKPGIICALSSLLFLISAVNMTANPFITRCALAIILGTFILIFSVKDRKNKYLIALFGLSLLVYTRPEYILSLIIFSLVSIIYLLYRYSKSHQRALLWGIVLTLLLNIFIVFVKNPARANRGVVAFGQHYGVHLYNQGKISENPNTHWRKIMKENFHTDRSLIQAFLNNPGEMTNHVLANIIDIPYQAMQHFFPYNLESKLIKKILLVISGLLFILLMILAYRKKKEQPFFHKNHLDENIFYWLSALIIIPLIISVCLIYPREHYLLVLFAILLTAAAKNVPAVPGNWKFKWVQPLIILFVLYWVPWPASGAPGLLPGKIVSIHDKTCTNAGKIRFIRNIKVKSPMVFLGYTGGMEPYIDDFQYVDKQGKNVSFNEFIQREKINMMIVDNGLLKDPRFISDDEFKDFIARIPDNNWLKIKIPGCGGYLAVNEDILD